MFIFVILKQDILFWTHLCICYLNILVSAPMEHIFWTDTITVQLFGILREVRSSLELRVKILFSFSMVVGMAALPQSMKIDL